MSWRYFTRAEFELPELASTITACNAGMNRLVLAIRQNFEIANIIVSTVAVFVMNNLTVFQRPTKMLGHHKPVLKNVPLRAGVRVFRHLNSKVGATDDSLLSFCKAATFVTTKVSRAFVVLRDKLAPTNFAWPFVVGNELSSPNLSGAGRRTRIGVDGTIRCKSSPAFGALFME